MSSTRRVDSTALACQAELDRQATSNRSGEQLAEQVDPVANLVAQLAQLELGAVRMLAALAGHHGDQQVGHVERPHHPVEEVALAARLGLDSRVPGDCFLGEIHERLVVTAPDGIDERHRDRSRRTGRIRGPAHAGLVPGELAASRRDPTRRRRRRREVTIEQQLEDTDVLGPLDERRLQGSPHEQALADADLLDGAQPVDRLGARSLDSGGAEVMGEADDRVEHASRSSRRDVASRRTALGGTVEYTTIFGSLDNYRKGTVEIIDDDPKHYAFSNVFEVAGMSAPYEKVAVGKNQQYVLEAIRAEGTSGWRTCDHDEAVLCMDGEVTVRLVKLAAPLAPAGKEGSIAIDGEPAGEEMGYVRIRRGHMALLPAGSAYRFEAEKASVLLQQTCLGDDTIERWADICLS